jgi:isopentenyldiphosphate isomerase
VELPTTAEEIAPLVDEEDRVVGTASRRQIRAGNLLHRGVAVLCRNPAGEVYVHRRTDAKDVFPGMYDLMVGGMVTAGESYPAAARRELAEELGIEGPEPAFLFMHRYRGDRNNAWIWVGEVVWDGPIRHQEDEVAWGAYLSLAELASRLREWPFAPDHREAFERYLAGLPPGRTPCGPGGMERPPPGVP